MSGQALEFAIALVEAGFDGFLGADIANHADNQGNTAMVSVEERDADLAPHLGAVFAKEALLDSVAGPDAPAKFVEQSQLDGLIFRMADARTRGAQQFVGGIPEHGAKSGIDFEDAPVNGFESNADGSLREKITKTLLTFLECGVGVFAFGGGTNDVGRDGQLIDGVLLPVFPFRIGTQAQDTLLARTVARGNQQQGLHAELPEKLLVHTRVRREVFQAP